MLRYIKIPVNFLTRTFPKRDLLKASYISGADYFIEDAHFGMLHHSYFISVTGKDEEISHFIGYLKARGIELQEF